MLVRHSIIQASIKFASTHLYTWVERGTVSVFKNTKPCPWPRIKPKPFDLELNTLTMRLPHLPQGWGADTGIGLASHPVGVSIISVAIETGSTRLDGRVTLAQ